MDVTRGKGLRAQGFVAHLGRSRRVCHGPVSGEGLCHPAVHPGPNKFEGKLLKGMGTVIGPVARTREAASEYFGKFAMNGSSKEGCY